MRQIISLLPMLAVLAIAPATAAEPDPHQGHHPAPPAAPPEPTPQDKASPDKCPMMSDHHGMADKEKGGEHKMGGHDMHCMDMGKHKGQAPDTPADPHAEHQGG